MDVSCCEREMMENALIKREDGFYKEGYNKPVYTYMDLPRYLQFHVSDWILQSSISPDEQTYRVEHPWQLIGPRKAGFEEISDEGPSLPIHFSTPASFSVSAVLQMEKHRGLAIIDESGCRPFDGKMHLSIRGAETGSGNVWHSSARESDDPDLSEEAIYWNLKLPREKMKWLRDELVCRPNAALILHLSFAAYRSVGESFGAEYWMHQTFSLEPDSWTPIVEAKVTVEHTGGEFLSLS